MAPKSILNFPIETEAAQKFWASTHILNQVKAIVAFSLNERNAFDNLQRYGYKLQFRKRVMKAYGKYVNNPSMSGVPFTSGVVNWWSEI